MILCEPQPLKENYRTGQLLMLPSLSSSVLLEVHFVNRSLKEHDHSADDWLNIEPGFSKGISVSKVLQQKN